MIPTILRISFINMRRDRVVQALTFLLPIIFFSIFALVFGNQRNPTSRINVAVADEDQSEYSKKLVAALSHEAGLRVQTHLQSDGTGEQLTAETAQALVKKGTLPAAIVLPKGLGQTRRIWTDPADKTGPKVKLLADVSDPIAPQVVQGLLQKVAFTAAPEALAEQGMATFEKYAGPLTPAQQEARQRWLSLIKENTSTGQATEAATGLGLPIDVVNVMNTGNNGGAAVSFYAAGIGVMFLLFSCSGAGGALLDEQEAGTLDRVIGSRAGMGGVLTGKWLFLLLMGVSQLTVMFTWGALVFGLPLLPHLPGFFVMAVFTAAAAAAFGLLLATISRSRQQLAGLSTILILTMSALGGSMFPRFMMSDAMQKIGRVTFNAWALDGFTKVFWRDAPITALLPEIGVLTAIATVLLIVARRFARKWETI